MANIWNSLSGYKTYIASAIGVLLVVAQHNGLSIPGVHMDDNLVWQSVLAACIRNGIGS